MQAVAILDLTVIVTVERIDEIEIGGLELGIKRIEETDLLQIAFALTTIVDAGGAAIDRIPGIVQA